MYQLHSVRRPVTRPTGPYNRFWQGVAAGALTFVLLALLTAGILLAGYAVMARDLPAPSELRQRASTFQTTRIYDSAGNLLNETFDPNTGRRIEVPLAAIAPAVIQATIATEDANFYTHPGIDPVALLRALYYAFQEGDVVSGASTITQQLVKRVLLSPERSATRKIKEAILAAEITRRYSKEEILELYFNEIYYGNFSYGIDAAAETYFGKEAADLTLAEAALLAGLPQLPAYYDPYTQPDRAKARQGVVLRLMVEAGFLTALEADAAWQTPLAYEPLQFNLQAPHFTLLVRQQLEQLLGPESLYQAGYSVYTTLDPRLQAAAEQIVRQQVSAIADRNVSNGALVALRPQTGEVVALVGSADFDNVEIDGQVNMALAPRQPGSATKPFVYLATFALPGRPPGEQWTPGMLLADITTAFPDGANPPYVPANYDNRELGLIPLRTALGTSRNIPAVAALQRTTLPLYLELMQRLGVTTLTRPDFGLSLALGAGEVPLLELTGAFAVLANAGQRLPPVTIQKITDVQGALVCAQGTSRPCQPGIEAATQVVSPADAFLITDILSDNAARAPVFGPNSLLRLDRPAAVKTGTTNDFRDNLTVGYTPQLVTGVWVGNADSSPMVNVSGVAGAGPIWNQFMTLAHAGEPVLAFTPPPGVRRYSVCVDTGAQPSLACPEQQEQWFAEDRPPLPPEQDLWRQIRMVRGTDQLATEYTPADQIEERPFKVYPVAYRDWAIRNGLSQPPIEAVVAPPTLAPGVLQLAIQSPGDGETVRGVVAVRGSAALPDLASYELQYGISHDPGAFSLPISGPFASAVIDGPLGTWDTTNLEPGPHTLRLLLRAANGTQYETRVRLFVDNLPSAEVPPPTATWTPVPPAEAPTATWTPVPPTEVPTATWTPVPPTEAPTATWTPVPPTEVPTATWTPVPPAEVPTATWTPVPPTEAPPLPVEG
ncbi:MAG: transglycosylase domain-containing protein [Caldilinea sp.]